MRAGMYERVSTGIRDTELSRSVDQQNREGEVAAREREWRIADRYPDPGLSASRYARRARPEWERLRADVRADRLDIVVMWESSRGSRTLGDWVGFLDDCRDHGVQIYVTKDESLYDLRKWKDYRELAGEGIENAGESERTSVRARRGIADAAERGEPYGRIPYGYARRYEHDPAHPKGRRPIQYPDPAESPVAAEIITRLAENDSLTGIIRDLSARGITRRDGKPWAHSSIARMVLEGVVYIGKRRHNGGELLDGNWPPLVDEGTYWSAVAVLRDPARRTNAGTRGGIRPGAARWLLSYIATCDECGAGLGVVTNRRRNGIPEPQYRCTHSQSTHCYAPVEWMDWLVGEAIVRWCAHPLVYEVLTASDEAAVSAARAHGAEERRRLAEFEAQAIAGALSATAYARIASGIEARIATLDARASAVTVPAELRGMVGARARDIAARWLDMPLTAQRSVVRKVAAPTLRPTGRGGNLLDPFRVQPGFIIRIPASETVTDPLLPVPAIIS